MGAIQGSKFLNAVVTQERYRSLQSTLEHVWPEQFAEHTFSDPEIPGSTAGTSEVLKCWGSRTLSCFGQAATWHVAKNCLLRSCSCEQHQPLQPSPVAFIPTLLLWLWAS